MLSLGSLKILFSNWFTSRRVELEKSLLPGCSEYNFNLSKQWAASFNEILSSISSFCSSESFESLLLLSSVSIVWLLAIIYNSLVHKFWSMATNPLLALNSVILTTLAISNALTFKTSSLIATPTLQLRAMKFLNASSIFVNFPYLSVFLDGSPLHFLYASKYFSFLLIIVLIFEEDLKLYFFLSTHKSLSHQPLRVLFPLYQSTESIFFSFSPFLKLFNTYALEIFFFVILVRIYFLT